MTDRFELVEELGAGGMGVVWKARDAETGEVVALKLVHAHLARDPDYVARFEREVEVARRIDSPHVVKVLGYGTREGIPFMAMEYVEGQSLRDLLRERGKFTWEEAKPIVRQVAEGLAAAHAAGIIHRDVKPSNILLTKDGAAKLADFGIARALDMTRLTGSSTMLGTPHYMAPDTETTAESDLYSLGCVLFEMLAGRPPFEGDTQQQVLLKHVREEVDLGLVESGEARALLSRLLQKDPALRLEAAHAGGARASESYVQSSRPGRGRLVALAVIVAVAVGGGVAAVIASGGSGDAPADVDTLPEASATVPGTTTKTPSVVSTGEPAWSSSDVWEWPAEMFAGPVCGVTLTLDEPNRECMAGFMREHGASEPAVEFFQQTGLFLTEFREVGLVDYGRSAAPWFNMGRPTPHLLLNGVPGIQEVIGLPMGWEGDPGYVAFAANHPDASPWWEYGVLDSTTIGASGRQALTLRYPLRSCRACDDVGELLVRIEIDPVGRGSTQYVVQVIETSAPPADDGFPSAAAAISWFLGDLLNTDAPAQDSLVFDESPCSGICVTTQGAIAMSTLFTIELGVEQGVRVVLEQAAGRWSVGDFSLIGAAYGDVWPEPFGAPSVIYETVSDNRSGVWFDIGGIELYPDRIRVRMSFRNQTASAVAWTSDVDVTGIKVIASDGTEYPSVAVGGRFAVDAPGGLPPGGIWKGYHEFMVPPGVQAVTLYYPARPPLQLSLRSRLE